MGVLGDPRWQSVLGFAVFWLIAWSFSERRGRIPPLRRFGAVLVFQLGLGFLFLRWEPARDSLGAINILVTALSQATGEATSFLFGYAGRTADLPFEIVEGGEGGLFVFALQGLPLIVFVAALSAVLWHWGILKIIIQGFALVITRLLGTGGAVSLSAAANVLLGQTEAPLLIRPLLRNLSRSELFAVITCGFSTVAGTVMVLYATILAPISDEQMLGHIFVASIIAVPSALLMAELVVPPAPHDEPTRVQDSASGFQYKSTMDAFTAGATEGGKLWANIVVAILAFIALAALCNLILANLPNLGGEPLTMERILGWVFAPLVWLAGVPWDQAPAAGQIMGIKTILNEVIAYSALAESGDALDERSKFIMVYALCGFANVGSLGIVIGGLSALEASRRPEIIELAPKALVSGTLATLSSGAAVGLLF
ncbi:MAG: nucleoside transporter C-terminal domain-containing protein [Pseudomonadota bacterium]